MVSASFLLLTKTRQGGSLRSTSINRLKLACTRGVTPSSMPPTSSSASGCAHSTVKSVSRSPMAMIALPRFGDSHSATSCGFPTVADSPIRCTFRPDRASNLARPRESCHPRSLAARSCTSSTITARTEPSNFLKFLPVNINWKVSGVVTKR